MVKRGEYHMMLGQAAKNTHDCQFAVEGEETEAPMSLGYILL